MSAATVPVSPGRSTRRMVCVKPGSLLLMPGLAADSTFGTARRVGATASRHSGTSSFDFPPLQQCAGDGQRSCDRGRTRGSFVGGPSGADLRRSQRTQLASTLIASNALQGRLARSRNPRDTRSASTLAGRRYAAPLHVTNRDRPAELHGPPVDAHRKRGVFGGVVAKNRVPVPCNPGARRVPCWPSRPSETRTGPSGLTPDEESQQPTLDAVVWMWGSLRPARQAAADDAALQLRRCPQTTELRGFIRRTCEPIGHRSPRGSGTASGADGSWRSRTQRTARLAATCRVSGESASGTPLRQRPHNFAA